MIKMIKESKGITLIALVITIIILIILAGVSMNLLLGNNGILTKSIEGQELYQKAKHEEEIQFAIFEEETIRIGEIKDKLFSKMCPLTLKIVEIAKRPHNLT